jgi:hypothetical protein
MKKTLLMMGCIVVFLIISSVVTAQILSPIASLEGTVDKDAMVFTIGSTRFSDNFKGYSYDELPSNPLFDELNVFPLFGTCIFEGIDTVTIFDLNFTNLDTLEGILNFSMNNISQFSNVHIIAEKGPFLFGNEQGKIKIIADLDYAISSSINLNFYGENEIPFLALITPSSMNIEVISSSAFLVLPFSTGNIKITDSNGNELWSDDSPNKILFIEDDSLTFHQDSPLFLLPLVETNEDLLLTIAPSELNDIDITSLFEEITDITSGLMDMPDISNILQDFDEILPFISTIINGGLIIYESDDTFTIDNSPQTFSNFGFARANEFTMTITPETQIKKIDGNFKLIFLGDHFYTSQAKDSDNGLSFPYPIIIVWIIAVVLFLLFRFYIKKDANKEFDENIKRFLLLFHIIAIIITFILMDREISFQFGSSALDALFGQGITLILGAFIIIELLMWTLGFFLFSFPIYLITKSGLTYLEIGKDGKHLSKGVGIFFIWIFCAIYIKLIINILFLIINPSNFLQMG